MNIVPKLAFITHFCYATSSGVSFLLPFDKLAYYKKNVARRNTTIHNAAVFSYFSTPIFQKRHKAADL